MAENTQHRTPLPDGWCERVRSAMLVVISLAQDACPPPASKPRVGRRTDVPVQAHSRPLLDDRRPGGLPGACWADRR